MFQPFYTTKADGIAPYGAHRTRGPAPRNAAKRVGNAQSPAPHPRLWRLGFVAAGFWCILARVAAPLAV